MEDIVSTAEAAAITGKSEQYIRRMLKSGRLAGRQVGKTWIVTETGEGLRKAAESGFKKVRDKPNTMAKLPERKVLSFFSGAMGLDLGLEQAGLIPLLASEIDNAARETILTNRHDIGLIGDIRNYTKEEIFQAAGLTPEAEIDVLVGGPPCQSFSTAGKRRGLSDDRGDLLQYYVKLICEIKPKIAVIENVRGLLSAPLQHTPHAQRTGEENSDVKALSGGALMRILRKLRDGGYGVSFNLYNAANFGAPQIRERVVMLCSRDGKVLPYLKPTHAENGAFGLPTWRCLREALEGLPTEQHALKFPEKRLRFYRMLKAGQNWRSLPIEFQEEAMGKSFHAGGGKSGFYRRLAWDKPSPTLVTQPTMPATDLAHPEEDRPLSIEEYKRIQEFPDDWIVCGTLVEQYKQIGNAVPISLGRAVGKALVDALNGQNWMIPEGFQFSRYKGTGIHEWEKKYNLSHSKIKWRHSLLEA